MSRLLKIQIFILIRSGYIDLWVVELKSSNLWPVRLELTTLRLWDLRAADCAMVLVMKKLLPLFFKILKKMLLYFSIVSHNFS